jgi:hypothetical protein
MSAEIKPGQVWEYKRTSDTEPVTVTDVRNGTVTYVFAADQSDGDMSVVAFRKMRRLVTDTTPAPLDPTLVQAGDTVTVRVEDSELGTYEIKGTVTGHLGGILQVGSAVIAHNGTWRDIVTLIAHQPAPKPEWRPGTTGTATVLDTPNVRVMRTDGTVNGVDIAWVSAVHVAGSRMHHAPQVTDFVPDETRPLPTVEALADAMHDDHLPGGLPRLSRENRINLARVVLASLRGESR